jgi:hypothetical protein
MEHRSNSLTTRENEVIELNELVFRGALFEFQLRHFPAISVRLRRRQLGQSSRYTESDGYIERRHLPGIPVYVAFGLPRFELDCCQPIC